MSVSNQSDNLQFNTELDQQRKRIPETQGLASAVFVEENKDGHRDNQIAHAQDSYMDPIEDLMDNGQTRQPPAAVTDPVDAPTKQKKSGAANKKLKKQKEVERQTLVSRGGSQISLDQALIVEADTFTVLSRHGFYGELDAKIGQFEDPTLKLIGHDMLKTGLLALKPHEVYVHSLKWVEDRVVPAYLWTIQNRDQERAKALIDKMSPVDHINAVLKLVPKHYHHENALTALAGSFYDYGKLLTEEELKFYSNGNIEGIETFARCVLNMGIAEMQLNRYRVVALLFRLGQADEIQVFLTKYKIKEVNWKTYNFSMYPAAGKTREPGKILYQVMYAYRLAFYTRPETVRFVMNRRKQLLKEVNLKNLFRLRDG